MRINREQLKQLVLEEIENSRINEGKALPWDSRDLDPAGNIRSADVGGRQRVGPDGDPYAKGETQPADLCSRSATKRGARSGDYADEVA